MSTLSFAGEMARLQRAIAESHDLVVRRSSRAALDRMEVQQ
jgi:hypothetical protein